jgi:hypothetical protein
MKRLISLLLILVLGAGCSIPGDPMLGDLYTNNIFPGTNSTYDIGATDNYYNNAYINNIYIGGVWDDLRTPVNAVKLGGVNPPVDILYNGGMLLSFEDKILSQEQIVYFTIQLPHNWKEGTSLEPHIHWTAEDGTAGNIVWLLTYAWVNIEDIMPVYSEVIAVGSTGEGYGKHIVTNFGLINGIDKKVSSMLVCSVKRNSSNILDTYNGKSAYFMEIDFHYQIGSIGSVSLTGQ